MRCLVISDIHANLHAFETVLADAKGLFEKVWCLGDLVSRGSYPNECVELLLTLDHLCVAGHGDWLVLGKVDSECISQSARASFLWTREQLTSKVQAYLNSLPVILKYSDFTLVHGSPREPLWEYILDSTIAAVSFAHLATKYCFHGHTHLPVIFQETTSDDALPDVFSPCHDNGSVNFGEPFDLGEHRSLINPGSLGGGNKFSANRFSMYGLLDTEKMTFEFRRVPLAIEK